MHSISINTIIVLQEVFKEIISWYITVTQGQLYCTPHACSEVSYNSLDVSTHCIHVPYFTYNRSAKFEFMPVHSAMVSTYREYLKLLMLYRPPISDRWTDEKIMIHGHLAMYILSLNSPNKLKCNIAILYYQST